MPFKYLPDIAVADAAFEAWGDTLESVFISCADALVGVMVDDISFIEGKEEVELRLFNTELEMVLFDFLNELVYIKDAKRLLLRVQKVEISEQGGGFELIGKASGEQINPAKHRLQADVKAVTLSRFSLVLEEHGWRAQVVVDI